MKSAHIQNQHISQLGVRGRFPASIRPFISPQPSERIGLLSKPPLAKRVLSVVFWTPKEEMVRIAARPIITSVANKHSLRYWTKCKFPCRSVGIKPLHFETETSVSSRSFSPLPLPTTFITFFDSIPKTFFGYHASRISDNYNTSTLKTYA